MEKSNPYLISSWRTITEDGIDFLLGNVFGQPIKEKLLYVDLADDFAITDKGEYILEKVKTDEEDEGDSLFS
jgi:hypothetical protein